MARRIHSRTPLRPGELRVSEREAHHARDVLRLAIGDEVELFDDAGATAGGTIVSCDADGVVVRVDALTSNATRDVTIQLTVAAAVPKGDRADWMVEKLSELGVVRLIPLATARSVVLPEGKNKRDRWTRIATEAAKQSRRRGVMRVDELTNLPNALRNAARAGACWHLSTAAGARPVLEVLGAGAPPALTAFIGPEGGWTDDELAQFIAAGVAGVKLTPTVLRVETAALAVAAVVGSVSPPNP